MQSLKDTKDTNQFQLNTSPAPGLASVICLLCLLSVWVLLTKVYGAIDMMNPCTPVRPPCAITANLFRHVCTWNRDVPAGVSLHLLWRHNRHVQTCSGNFTGRGKNNLGAFTVVVKQNEGYLYSHFLILHPVARVY